jgi:hypothetical protein
VGSHSIDFLPQRYEIKLPATEVSATPLGVIRSTPTSARRQLSTVAQGTLDVFRTKQPDKSILTDCRLENQLDLTSRTTQQRFSSQSKAFKMDTLQTHPATAQQAKAFTSPSSLSFPGGAGDLTPPSSEKEGHASQKNGTNGVVNGQGDGPTSGNGATPATPAATPGASHDAGPSGIVPTLQ